MGGGGDYSEVTGGGGSFGGGGKRSYEEVYNQTSAENTSVHVEGLSPMSTGIHANVVETKAYTY